MPFFLWNVTVINNKNINTRWKYEFKMRVLRFTSGTTQRAGFKELETQLWLKTSQHDYLMYLLHLFLERCKPSHSFNAFITIHKHQRRTHAVFYITEHAPFETFRGHRGRSVWQGPLPLIVRSSTFESHLEHMWESYVRGEFNMYSIYIDNLKSCLCASFNMHLHEIVHVITSVYGHRTPPHPPDICSPMKNGHLPPKWLAGVDICTPPPASQNKKEWSF